MGAGCDQESQRQRQRDQAAQVRGESHVYPQARHEILNEINHAGVIAAIASWVDRVLSSAGVQRPD